MDCYNRRGLDGASPSLTLAHIIPSSLGGKTCTLTCTRCNNGNGGTIEPLLTERFEAEDWSQGNGQIEARMSGPFGNIGVEWEQSPNGSRVNGVPRQSNAVDLARFEDYLTQKANDPESVVEFSLSIRHRHEPKRLEAAVYQSAFLLMFSHFGYEFAAHRQYIPLRRRITKYDLESWRTIILDVVEESVEPILGTQNHAVLFHRKPPIIVAMLRMRPRGGRSRVLGVVLPGPDSELIPEFSSNVVEDGHPVIYRPHLLKTRGYLRALWRHVQGK
jgi:hypothetical protein